MVLKFLLYWWVVENCGGWVVIMLALKEILFLLSSGGQENLLSPGDWQIGCRKCKIFFLNCILLLTMSCELREANAIVDGLAREGVFRLRVLF